MPSELPPEQRAAFQQALNWVLKWEGGYVNHPNDPGGETNRGVTKAVYDAYRQSKGLPTRSVKDIDPAEVTDIYYSRYYQQFLAWGLSSRQLWAVFNIAVNGGVGTAKALIRRTNVRGIHHKTQAEQWLRAFVEETAAYYQRIIQRNPRLRVFQRGWQNRTNDLKQALKIA